MAIKRKEQCVSLTFQPIEAINQKLKDGWLVKSITPIHKKYSEEDALLIIFERDIIDLE